MSASKKLFNRKELFKLTFPLMIERSLTLLVGMIDSVMVSGVGEAAVSGVSLIDTVFQLLIYIFTAFGTRGAVVAGQYLGAGKKEEARTTLGQLVWFSALGKQMLKKFPLTVTMDKYGDREYYGDVAKRNRPTKKNKGKLTFVNGDITYCFENDTMAIFYNQSDEPNLSMRVNCIGRVTSDLSVFKEMGDSVTMTFEVS